MTLQRETRLQLEFTNHGYDGELDFRAIQSKVKTFQTVDRTMIVTFLLLLEILARVEVEIVQHNKHCSRISPNCLEILQEITEVRKTAKHIQSG